MISEKVKNFLFEETRKVLTNHEHFKDFKLTRYSCDLPDDDEEFIFYDTEEQIEREIKVTYGVTKLCLIFNYEDGYNYVVKIPFRRDINYCEIELKNYQKAVREGLSEYFAETDYVAELIIDSGDELENCTTMNFPIYLMERVLVDAIEASDQSYSYYKEKIYNNEEVDKDFIVDSYWSAIDSEEFTEAELCFKAAYGEDIATTLADFLCHYNINDIHTHNIGFRDWVHPVFIDYSGYHG